MHEIMSRRVVAVALAAALACSSSLASARPRPGGGTHPFEANKTFGLGLMVGAPTGLTGKYFVASDRAFDFGLGAIYYYRHGNGLHIHGDYLWHPVSLVHAEPFELPLYIGVGARLWSFDCDGCSNNATAIGVRVPFGIDFDFNDVPLDIFFELVFVADVFVNYQGHDFGPDLDGALGARFWFD
jgi:hypothetical protein